MASQTAQRTRSRSPRRRESSPDRPKPPVPRLTPKKPVVSQRIEKDATDPKRIAAIGNLQKKGIVDTVAKAIERGLYCAATTGEKSMNDKEYKEYQYNYKRICQHFRRNPELLKKLSTATREVLLFAESLGSLSDDKLMSEEQRVLQEQYKQEGLLEALGVDVKDDGMWTPTDVYNCQKCNSENCRYLNTILSSRKEDQSDDPVVTVRCADCSYLWKAEGDTFSG